jgi:hypothetical protein
MPSRLLTPPARKKILPRSLLNRRVDVRRSCSRSTSSRVSAGSNAKSRWAKIRDISVGGVALILSSPLKIGADLLIRMKNPHLSISYDLAARVVHATSQTRGRWLVGCAFARELSPLELETLL